MYKHTFCLSSAKYSLPVVPIVKCAHCRHYNLACLSVANNTNTQDRIVCWQWTHFTMGPNEQNQHFAELRQKIHLYIHVVAMFSNRNTMYTKVRLPTGVSQAAGDELVSRETIVYSPNA